ncbi:MAG TPA: class I SAM-dependent methyltransferase [Sedimentisphaerales bacterium]|nr:class I SAM-dependent methyltransferase [Sedimentisphaerales bacterium]
MKLTDFVCEENARVFLPPDKKWKAIKDFAYLDGAESYLLTTLKNANDLSDYSEELQLKIKDWPTQYHFGQGRSNILRALGIGGKLKVLELGSGCGALSRYLGETCETVDCVEGSYIRAKIGRERCRDLNMLRVFCSNIIDSTFEPTYDIVTLIGVWEYAPAYIKAPGHQACKRLLELANSALKDDGTLIIAIENKIGLKYWCGSPDDHTDRIYDGIHGYPGKRPAKKSAVTFSKNEIGKYLRGIGLEYIHFYHCFPDYKFASTIFSDLGNDDELYLHNWIDVPFNHPGAVREYIIHEGLALRTLSRAGLLREFANSFLVVASKSNTSVLLKPDWIAKKISGFPRRRRYRCITTLKNAEELCIEKENLHTEPENARLSATSNAQQLSHRVMKSAWYPGDLLLFDAYEAIFSNDIKTELTELLKRYYEELISRFHTGKNDKDGYPLLRGDCFDFILKNIVKKDKELVFIDTEWSVLKELPGDYLLYRCLKHDIIKTQCPRMKALMRKHRKFTIPIIKAFFPQYSKKRYNQNSKLDRMLLGAVCKS